MKTESKKLIHLAGQLGFKSLQRYQNRMTFLLKNVEIANTRVLDVGCGKGALALWSALHGAKYVLGIEPEEDGCTHGAIQEFKQLIQTLGLSDRVDAKNWHLQDIKIDEPFDIILMYNVINHLDAEAVKHLHDDPQSFQKYLPIAKFLRSLLKPGGIILLADCGRNNFWDRIGLKSPIPSSRCINWQCHQEPEVWINLMEKAGFKLWDLRWSSLYPFYSLTANKLIQYLTTSHFVLRLKASI